MISIIKLMDKDHKKIKELLLVFENSETIQNFNRFKWNLQKHFFIEEKVIFNTDSLGEDNENLSLILNEHSQILNLMDMLEEDLIDNKKPKTAEMKHLLLNHARFEDEVFYPKLDEILDEQQKQNIIDRTKDIIIE